MTRLPRARAFLSVLGGFVLLASGCAAGPEVRRFATAAELKQKLDNREVRLFDALPVENYRKEHIAGAESVPYDRVSEKTLPADKAAAIAFYCAGKGCPVSGMAANRAVKAGYTNVWIFEGGLDEWRRAKLPLEKAGQSN